MSLQRSVGVASGRRQTQIFSRLAQWRAQYADRPNVRWSRSHPSIRERFELAGSELRGASSRNVSRSWHQIVAPVTKVDFFRGANNIPGHKPDFEGKIVN